MVCGIWQTTDAANMHVRVCVPHSIMYYGALNFTHWWTVAGSLYRTHPWDICHMNICIKLNTIWLNSLLLQFNFGINRNMHRFMHISRFSNWYFFSVVLDMFTSCAAHISRFITGMFCVYCASSSYFVQFWLSRLSLTFSWNLLNIL